MKAFSEIVAANDEQHVVDLLISAHGVSVDPVTRRFIELALLHEGRKISKTLPLQDQLNETGT